MSGDAARKSACVTLVARTLVFAAFALLRTHGISMLKPKISANCHSETDGVIQRIAPVPFLAGVVTGTRILSCANSTGPL